MKCPHCGYQDDIAGNVEGHVQGDKGDFFTGGYVMKREHHRYETMSEHVKLYGCPSCTKTFIGSIFY